ncbi:MAG: hypothetical protein SFU98_21620 [Leptospiraceae bacterium]|nr:hypothetical protein [Leptospiraceae bacterium]
MILVNYRDWYINVDHIVDSPLFDLDHFFKEEKRIDLPVEEKEYFLKSLNLFFRLGEPKDDRQVPYKVYEPVSGLIYVEIDDWKKQ